MTSRRMRKCLEHALQVVEFGLASSNGRCGRFAAMFSESANSRQALFSDASNHNIWRRDTRCLHGILDHRSVARVEKITKSDISGLGSFLERKR